MAWKAKKASEVTVDGRQLTMADPDLQRMAERHSARHCTDNPGQQRTNA
ncbi:MAG: hypothetical protein MZV63_34915 [Marinilabiliales bacterium]|nr:hypothetical protein [Marinilabiliales bacterium]